MFYVYIIYSLSFDKYYRGYSENPLRRLEQHNRGESNYTKSFGPWSLVFVQSFELKKDALKREKVLKKYSKSQIVRLMNTPLNELL